MLQKGEIKSENPHVFSGISKNSCFALILRPPQNKKKVRQILRTFFNHS